jgi:DNA-binding transcriptional LysR family regulator
MELRHLRYFVAAAETLNFTRAAKHLHVSQPPLSRQIQDLEREIGAALFDRDRNKLKLTAAGEYFLQEAKKILTQAHQAARLAKAAADGKAGRLTIAFLSPLGGLFLPRVIRSFRQRLPLADVDLCEMVPRMQLEALLDNQIDLAFVPKAEAASGSEFAIEPVVAVELRVAIALDHPLAKLRRIPIARLEGEQFIILKKSAAPATHDLLLGICRSSGFEPDVVRQSDRAQSILDLVAAGIGVSIVPEHFQRYQSDLVLRALTPKPPRVPLCMVWRRNDRSPMLRTFRGMVRRHFGQQLRENA